MSKYLISVYYTADGAMGLRKDGGTKRREAVRKAVASVGGKLDSLYFCLGDMDAILIVDLPDAVAVASLSLAVSATGAVRLVSTPLLTPEDMDKASKKKTVYKAPGK
jgi:uncharacterized protein with GYD domain